MKEEATTNNNKDGDHNDITTNILSKEEEEEESFNYNSSMTNDLNVTVTDEGTKNSKDQSIIQHAMEQLQQSVQDIWMVDQKDNSQSSPGHNNNTSFHWMDNIRNPIQQSVSECNHESILEFFGEDGNATSDWEEGMAVIESILMSGSKAREGLSESQVEGLRKVQHMFYGSSSSSTTTTITNRRRGSHIADIPRELLRNIPEPGSTSDYILSTYAGVKRVKAKQRVRSVINANRFIYRLQVQTSSSRRMTVRDKEAYILPEWSRLDPSEQKQLSILLSWESLQKWDYDVFEVDRLTHGQPLLFIGWALLASPYSQYVMEQSLPQKTLSERQESSLSLTSSVCDTTASTTVTLPPSLDDMAGYGYVDEFKIPQDCLVNFLRAVEKDYIPENPYHNHIHAADVLQTLHAILQGMDTKSLATAELEILSLLLAAVVHDMGHPGKNNSFQINSKSDLAIQYNDVSVLENMHAAMAFKYLLGSQKDAAMNIFEGMTEEQIVAVRKMMIESVLDTDMTHHFSSVNKIKGIRLSHKEHNTGNATSMHGGSHHGSMHFNNDEAWQILHFALHLADISNPAKPLPMALKWTDRCLEEFFQQGDEEKRLGLPVSPLCDRMATQRADSQIGFIKFVVQPAFDLLGKIVPQVRQQVLPILDENLAFWKGQKQKDEAASILLMEESERSNAADNGESKET